ncbi:unnamed protein product [Spirodela intermedia]|uniref:Methyltransferase n=1 Tax=Spirodela intermedia TaxID=51605 RepID=A0A7I8J4K5_SPIIN|nr:unnamed protein product [Spirodela intermedia]CAA6665176.1 unnamed protein product [Spirodela intermedia]
MPPKANGPDNRTRSSFSVLIVVGLCCFFYILGAWQKSGFGKGDNIALEITKQTSSSGDCGVLANLNFETHHDGGGIIPQAPNAKVEVFKPCPEKYTDYTPCQDQKRAMTFPRDNMIYRERHCPGKDEKLRCLIPAPKGYVTPFPWPKSRDYVPYANVPYKSLTVEKAVQNWVHYEGNVFRFPGGGRSFRRGQMRTLTSLLLSVRAGKRSPAVIGVFGTMKLPYPSRAFDMAHCSRCLIPWSENDGMYMIEVDRVLRPGGYWVLSGPPINWKSHHRAWQRTEEDLRREQSKIEQVADLLCWEKVSEKGDIAVWRKRINGESCTARQDASEPNMCTAPNPDDVQEDGACVTPLPEVGDPGEVAGGEILPFPARLNAVPPRVARGSIPGVSTEAYRKDNRLWKKHVEAYKKINKYLVSGRYRNVMDMNAGLGGFAAAIESPRLWVMNVVPTIAEPSSLAAIYERGLIGIYHDWCEGFSTYPRTYDLIHASGVFSLYKNKCAVEEILLEMDRILRPEGAVIFRDEVDALVKVKRVAGGMRWDTKMYDHEDGPLVPEKILVAVKQYWVGGGNTTANS